MKITNISKGTRGLHTTSGPVYVDAGQTVDVELAKGEAGTLSKDWWATGKAAVAAKVETPTPTPTPTKPEGESEGEGEGDQTATYKAVHRGAGSFSIMDGEDNEVIEKITKAEAEKFNALSDEAKIEYVLDKAGK